MKSQQHVLYWCSVNVDSAHFLAKLKHLNNTGTLHNHKIIHVSFDIVEMFPSIPKDFGLRQCRQNLDKREDPLFSTDCIIEALDITLSHNVTEFDGVLRKQKYGTGMGPKNSCPYADNSVDYIDQKIHSEDEGPECKPVSWSRFRDDIYTPWIYGLQALIIFFEWLNTLHPTIKFTMNHSIDEGTTCNCNAKSHSIGGIEYLELFVYDKNGVLHTKSWSKPSDTHTYIVPTSCHPTHVLKNIPFSIASLIARNSSENCEYEISKQEYIAYLQARGYNNDLIDDAFSRAEKKYRSESHHEKDKDSDNKINIPFVMDFNPGLPNASRIIHKYKHIIDMDDTLPFKSKDIFVSYRRAKTIKDLLVHSRFKKNVETNNDILEDDGNKGCYPCPTGCTLCKNFLVSGSSFKSYHCRDTYQIRDHLTCETQGVIYMVNVLRCERSYVGYATTNMKKRWANTKSHIKTFRKSCEVCTHIIECSNHSNIDRTTNKLYDETLKDEVEIVLLEKVRFPSNSTLQMKEELCRKREGEWQTKLKTLVRYGGLNKIDNRRGVVNNRKRGVYNKC